MTEKKFCLNCNDVLKGRSDKKFCDDQCRSTYNYARNALNNVNFVNRINITLKKNRTILKALNVTAKTKVKKESLIAEGFDFSYYTSVYETEKKSRYYFCYEMGYLIISDTEILLIEKELHPRTLA